MPVTIDGNVAQAAPARQAA